MSDDTRRPGSRSTDYLLTVAIVFAITFLIGLARTKQVSKEMMWDWLATSTALSIGICTGWAIRRRFD